MTGDAQTKKNRSVGGRKAALAVKARRAREIEIFGPEGSHRGSQVSAVRSIDEILARLAARQRAAAQ